ncbi:hypothetical protein CGCSCA4_v007084 [Colletotrichum siamense]|uniref:Uncharacterized protein n=1 Tax=Colletotrichum siamense TaxID=690259 RepID=A0A9P5K5L9_COLSI|nr:hypothetical protein CGCSCA4_v007084 [Colletotrichum siamense]KAF4859976.1 hypothetical protein CGCSCA2_v005857 [Colletotrichum siamense]
MLPDIHTIGLPFYGNEKRHGLGDIYRHVFVHNDWLTPAVLSNGGRVLKPKDNTYFRAKDIQLPSVSKRKRLWSAPSTVVRGRWRETVSPVDGRLGQGPTNFSIPVGVSQFPEPLQQAEPDASGVLAPVKQFARKVVVQFRLAQEKGLISSEVNLGDSGLTWNDMQEQLKYTEKLPDDMSITEMVTKDAARQADLLSREECTILRRLLDDIDNEANLPNCIRPFKQAIDPSKEDQSKSHVVSLLQEMGKPLLIQMNQIDAYIDQHGKGEDALAKHIIKPCCFLLGINYPGRPAEAHRAIFRVDSEVAMAVGDIMHENMTPTSGNLPNAIRRLKRSSKFMPVWRFIMFRIRLISEEFDETRKLVWQMAFGQPYKICLRPIEAGE